MKLPEKINNLIKFKKLFIIPKFIYFNLSDYKSNKVLILDRIKKNFIGKIIVRSASNLEDQNISNAGKYLSVGNINPKNLEKLSSAIKKVFDSYKSKKNQYVLVQKMLDKTKLSGVIFTVDRQNSLPFTTINYSYGKRTSLITSGYSNGRIIVHLNNYLKKTKNKLINFSITANKKLKNRPYDIEFCIDKDQKFKVFQIRRVNVKYNLKNPKKIINNLFFLKKKLSKMLDRNYLLTGNKTAFSTMADWNPAEILGTKPKPLALSLYKEIITNHIWSESRTELGYANVRSLPLLHDFIGTPYIDLRLDINSFFPKQLNIKIRNKIYKYYFNKFKKNAYTLHDKVEGKLIYNCVDFSTRNKIQSSFKNILTKKEINIFVDKLKILTNEIFKKIDSNIERYEKIDMILKEIKSQKIHPINKIYLLVNIAKYDAALPFANLARMAFVAISFLNSMVEKKIILNSEKENFINSIDLVTTKMLLSKNKMSKENFLKIFGHLRPDTYDIDQKNYNEGFKFYFGKNVYPKKRSKFKFTQKQIKLIKINLRKNNLQIDYNQFLKFLKKSIYHRENSKFFYSKVINEIFEEIKVIGKKFLINQNNLGYLKIEDLLNLYNNFSDTNRVAPILKEKIKKNKTNYNLNKELNLPDIIQNENDLICNFRNINNFTFIGQGNVSGKIKYLKSSKDLKKIQNKLVCIERADPGFDFIFSKKILGLITCYGGPNSHMSIRCNELGVPAVIGCGQSNFDEIINSRIVEINFDTKKILKLS